MRVRKISITGDWTFGHNKSDYLQGNNTIAQRIKTRLRFFKNDFFLDYKQGIDYYQILGMTNNQSILTREILRVVKQTDGVISINSFNYVIDDSQRNIDIKLNYNTVYSEDNNLTFDIINA